MGADQIKRIEPICMSVIKGFTTYLFSDIVCRISYLITKSFYIIVLLSINVYFRTYDINLTITERTLRKENIMKIY